VCTAFWVLLSACSGATVIDRVLPGNAGTG
jgi:hypothetical protein